MISQSLKTGSIASMQRPAVDRGIEKGREAARAGRWASKRRRVGALRKALFGQTAAIVDAASKRSQIRCKTPHKHIKTRLTPLKLIASYARYWSTPDGARNARQWGGTYMAKAKRSRVVPRERPEWRLRISKSLKCTKPCARSGDSDNLYKLGLIYSTGQELEPGAGAHVVQSGRVARFGSGQGMPSRAERARCRRTRSRRRSVPRASG